MAPRFERGFPSILSFALAAVVLVCKSYCHGQPPKAPTHADSEHAVVADFLHKRQLRQEAEAAENQPVSDAEVAEPADEQGKEVENKLAGAVEPVRNSSSII